MAFDIQGTQYIEYTLFSIEGRPLMIDLVNLNNGKANTELELSSYSSGIYFIIFESEGKSQTQRIILQ